MSAIAALSSGDTAWIIVSILVLLMSIPGAAFFYGGLAKRKRIKHNVFNYSYFVLIALIWVTYGYLFAFGSNN